MIEDDKDGDDEAMYANRRELPARSRTCESAVHRKTPQTSHLGGAASGCARSGYAGGSWRPSWHVRLGAAIRVEFRNGELADQDRLDRAKAQAGQNADDNGHAPTWRTGLANMVVNRIIVHRVPVDRPISMDVGNEMRFRMGVVRGIGRVLVLDVMVLIRCGF
jgi:hypothetical protein